MWGVIAIAAGVGVVLSVSDYIQWRRLETQRFGQGWADLQTAAKPLTWEYIDKTLGIRMILPAEWYGQDVKKYFKLRKGYGTEAEKKVWEEELPGGRVVIHQRLAKTVGKTTILMETTFGEEEWGKWEKTVEAMWASLQPL